MDQKGLESVDVPLQTMIRLMTKEMLAVEEVTAISFGRGNALDKKLPSEFYEANYTYNFYSYFKNSFCFGFFLPTHR